jgi:hypothetical protein
LRPGFTFTALADMLFRKLVKNVFYLGSRNLPNFSVSAQRYARFDG